MTFQHNIPYMVNAYMVTSLDILVIINITCKMNEILHDKMLIAIYLHCFHNDPIGGDNSLNGHSN